MRIASEGRSAGIILIFLQVLCILPVNPLSLGGRKVSFQWPERARVAFIPDLHLLVSYQMSVSPRLPAWEQIKELGWSSFSEAKVSAPSQAGVFLLPPGSYL